MRPSPPRGSRRHYYRRLWWIVGILLVVFASVSVQLFNSFQQTTTTAINEASTNENNQIPVLLRTTVSSKKNYQWAYVFLMAGCDAQAPLTYRNYLYNILVASKLIRQGGSQADIIVMVQFSKQSSSLINSTMTLSNSDLQWLKLFQIKVHYLPPPIRDNFYNAQLSKFRILELTQYSRVLYLDADVLPLCSLDYLLDLSSNGVLQPNLILAWFTEPAHGGLFVLEPGNYEEWQGILNRREQQALQLPYPHWDPVVGWGTNPLQEEWRGIPNGDEGTPARHSLNWTFHGDFAGKQLPSYCNGFCNCY